MPHARAGTLIGAVANSERKAFSVPRVERFVEIKVLHPRSRVKNCGAERAKVDRADTGAEFSLCARPQLRDASQCVSHN